VIETTYAERLCVTPPGLQDQINSLVRNFTNGRSFVRYDKHTHEWLSEVFYIFFYVGLLGCNVVWNCR
jgi:hypothetical protein